MVVSIVILNEAKHKTFLVRGFHCETNTVLAYFPFLLLRNAFFIFDLLSSTLFAADKQHHAWIFIPRTQRLAEFLQLIGICRHFRGKWKAHGAEVRLRSQFRKKPLKQWCAVNAVSTCWNTLNFFDYLVIFRHYFIGDGNVSCILATISDWFPKMKI